MYVAYAKLPLATQEVQFFSYKKHLKHTKLAGQFLFEKFLYSYMHAYMYCAYIAMYVHTFIHTYSYTYTYMHACIHAYYIEAYIHMYVHIYIYTCIRTCMHCYIYIQHSCTTTYIQYIHKYMHARLCWHNLSRGDL